MSTDKEPETIELVLKFEPNTIEHLGVKMYSHIPPALAELIANAYDACAEEVEVKLYNGDEKKIIIKDTGSGMTFDEINDHFLRIGRNRRVEKQAPLCGRIPTGKKGLGKLALFGLGNIVEIETIKDGEQVKFILNYNDILKQKGEYKPLTERETIEDKEISGTTITLKELKHQADFSAEEYSTSLARLFNFKDDGNPPFNLSISLNDEEPIKIDNKLKYNSIKPEFEWDEIAILKTVTSNFGDKDKIKGKIITTEKPLKPGLRGITLFAHGRMVNSPEFFGQSESSHFYSYASGWLDVDFVDDWDEDVISTNRQSIDWENPKTQELKTYLGNILTTLERDWRAKRKDKRTSEIQSSTNINIDNWKDTLPPQVRSAIETLLSNVEKSELTKEEQSETVKTLHGLVPEYPNLHWRNIHPEIQKVSERYYKNADYYSAFIEALKRYIAEVRKKSGSTIHNDRSLMQAVFSGRILKVTKKYKKRDGSDFAPDTITNIETGQQYLSEGVVAGGRNPLQHEEHEELSVTGLFSEKDCLDYLSILSHLFKRLDDSETP
jgi:uncharacterized protein (TIGR02391 family)